MKHGFLKKCDKNRNQCTYKTRLVLDWFDNVSITPIPSFGYSSWPPTSVSDYFIQCTENQSRSKKMNKKIEKTIKQHTCEKNVNWFECNYFSPLVGPFLKIIKFLL